MPRASLRGLLRQVHALGFRPRTIVDVGVDRGTPELYDTFSDVRYILIEPLEERHAGLLRLCETLPDARLVPAAAAARAGEVTLHVHADLAGSSLLREVDGPLVDGEPRRVETVTVDASCAEHDTRGPYLLKVDTQGSELEVLRGGARVLAESELVVLETSLFGFFAGGPQLGDVVAFMKERGLVVYDVFGAHYRPLDGALAQIDLAFVREDDPRFRGSHRFASEAEREAIARRRREGLLGRVRRTLGRWLS